MKNKRLKMHELEAGVSLAQAGDRNALESVVYTVQQDIYSVALHFLWHPQDAEDATQEILIRIITHLGSFRGDSNFKTWVYRITSNTLLTLKKKRMERQAMSFEEFADDLAQDASNDLLRIDCDLDEKLLLEEVKIGCTLAMLMCLNRNQRLAYILGEILELDHSEATTVLEVTPATFRKQLSRARKSILSFMTSQCGLVNPLNTCRCRNRVDTAVNLGRVDPDNLFFACSLEKAKSFSPVLEKIRQLEGARRSAALYRSHTNPIPSKMFILWMRKVLDEPEHFRRMLNTD